MYSIFNEEGSLNSPVLEDEIKSYFYSTGISAFAIDDEGNNIYSMGDAFSFCSFLSDLTHNACPCKPAHLYASKQAASIGEAYIFYCPAGLVHFAVPLLYKKAFKGAVIGGPVVMDYPDDSMSDEIINKNKLSVNLRGKISGFLKTIPVVEPKRVTYLSRMLFMTTLGMIGDERDLLLEKNLIMNQQSKISESIHDIKKYEHISNYYPYEKEKELLIKVKNGDVTGAKSILNELLGHVFFSSGGNLEVIKARALELITLLSRAAVEGGGVLDRIFGMNYKFIGELSKINNTVELSYWILKVLDRFTENVFNLSNSKNIDVIKNSVNYINEHYREHITLNKISEYVHLNSSYFSSLFKKETGMNLIDYINKVRISESKRLLKNMDYSILDVSIEVGYEDQSYYCKVFKKVTGMTPRQYKERDI